MRLFIFTENFSKNLENIETHYLKQDSKNFKGLLSQLFSEKLNQILEFPFAFKEVLPTDDVDQLLRSRYEKTRKTSQASWREFFIGNYAGIYYVTVKEIVFVAFKDQRQSDYEYSIFT